MKIVMIRQIGKIFSYAAAAAMALLIGVGSCTSDVSAKDADGNEIGTFDNKMKGTKTEGDRTYDSDIVIYRLAEMR